MAKEPETPDLWRFKVGRRGVNLVTVYERYPKSNIYIEWWHKGKRHQRALKTPLGEPVVDRKLAQALAVQLSEEQAKQHKQRSYMAVFGAPPAEQQQFKTLGDLLQRLHGDKEAEWSEQYVKDQARYRKFWLTTLGEGIRLHDVTPAMVEAAVRDETAARSKNGRRPWSKRSQQATLKYIKDAYRYAQRKLQWVDEAHNLSPVTLPKVRSRGEAFTLEEVQRLLPALQSIDVRAGWIGHVLWQTGRRLGAAVTLPKECVQPYADGAFLIQWPAETDKPRLGGESVIVGTAAVLTEQLMKQPGKYVLGTKLPRKDYHVRKWMTDALAAAKIPPRRGLGWHSLKRRFSDRTKGLEGRAQQSGTREDTLATRYDPADDRAAKAAVAAELDAQLKREPKQ